jgi:hypothetical protein
MLLFSGLTYLWPNGCPRKGSWLKSGNYLYGCIKVAVKLSRRGHLVVDVSGHVPAAMLHLVAGRIPLKWSRIYRCFITRAKAESLHWRIIFQWSNGQASKVEIMDYH